MRPRPTTYLLGFALLVSFAAPSCGLGPRVTVVVELQTDLVPRIEFSAVRTTIGGEEDLLPVGDTSFLRPARVAELRASPGTVRVRVQLLDDAGVVRAERLLIVEVRRDSGVVAFISAQCRGVICPGEDQTCIRGMCQDASSVCGGQPCRPGGETCTGSECDDPDRFCPRGVCDDQCMTADMCTSTDPCSVAQCEEKVCIGVPREGACPPGFFCAVGVGCTDVPPDVNYDGGMSSDASLPDGGPLDASNPDAGDPYCVPCTTNCGTAGFGVCVDGVPTGECVPPEEYCNGRDEDCDDETDEGLDCSHEHGITCQLGRRVRPDMTTVPNIIDRISGGGPGLVCGGGTCFATLTNCTTLPAEPDSHRHNVSIGGGGGLTIIDDVPFSVSANVSSASGHRHGARCGIGAGSIEIEGGLAFHRILPMGDDDELMPVGRYNMFCVPPVGDPTTECRPMALFCQTN